MIYSSTYFLSTLALAGTAFASPLKVRGANSSVCLPQFDANPSARAAGVSARDAGFTYGPSLIGNASYFPNGTLGNARQEADMALWQVDRDYIDQATAKDVASLTQFLTTAAAANQSIKTMEQFGQAFYQNQWKNTNPRGVAPGIMTNFTQDLYFSMERLTQNPYPLKLVTGTSPFQVDTAVVKNLTGTTLEDIISRKKLFVVDHSYQNGLDKSTIAPARYGAACTGLFYICDKTGNFLPLAIKTNVGKDLIYTPADSATDWLLAKMMFNVNDMFDAQMFHLVASHDVSEGVHQAALHTLSEAHPIMIVLERMMIQGYSSRIVGEELCFNPGGHWDQTMYVSQLGCRDYVSNTWNTTGRYLANYLDTDLKARGILDSDGKHPFKNYPFYDDAKAIRDAFSTFFTSFIDSYYPTDDVLAADFEVQNWFKEANGKAAVLDFPAEVNKETLVEVLTHFGYIVSVVHHVLNGGSTADSKAVMPFHMPALFAPVPEAKGVTDLMPFLSQPAQSIHYIGFVASFNRPTYAGEKLSLENAFSNGTLLQQLNSKTGEAAATFLSSMSAQSEKIRSRTFDANGLIEGAPFEYRLLDPNYIPFFCSV